MTSSTSVTPSSPHRFQPDPLPLPSTSTLPVPLHPTTATTSAPPPLPLPAQLHSQPQPNPQPLPQSYIGALPPPPAPLHDTTTTTTTTTTTSTSEGTSCDDVSYYGREDASAIALSSPSLSLSASPDWPSHPATHPSSSSSSAATAATAPFQTPLVSTNSYAHDDRDARLERAVALVTSCRYSVRKAAHALRLPKSTVHRYLQATRAPFISKPSSLLSSRRQRSVQQTKQPSKCDISFLIDQTA